MLESSLTRPFTHRRFFIHIRLVPHSRSPKATFIPFDLGLESGAALWQEELRRHARIHLTDHNRA